MDNSENEVLNTKREERKEYCNNNISIYSCTITRNYIRSIYPNNKNCQKDRKYSKRRNKENNNSTTKKMKNKIQVQILMILVQVLVQVITQILIQYKNLIQIL